MTKVEEVQVSSLVGQRSLSAVLCGSFRRDRRGLQEAFLALSQRFFVLAPVSLNFVDPTAPFVRLEPELNEPAASVEARHLASIRRADFVWLFVPDGYVGTSASAEVGFARAAGVPIFTDTQPTDEVIAGMVTVVSGLDDVETLLVPEPGEGVAALQDYYRRIAQRRGWADESPRDTLLLMTEEMGELARAVRKEVGLARDGVFPEGSVGEELADLQLYLVHLASALGVDLGSAVTTKERANAERHSRRSLNAA